MITEERGLLHSIVCNPLFPPFAIDIETVGSGKQACKSLYDALGHLYDRTTDVMDGLDLCLSCLEITTPEDRVYDVPNIGKVTVTLRPVTPLQFMRAVDLVFAFRAHNMTCDVLPSVPIVESNGQYVVEVVVESFVIFIHPSVPTHYTIDDYCDVLDVKTTQHETIDSVRDYVMDTRARMQQENKQEV